MSQPDDPLHAADPRVRARTAAMLGQPGRWPRGTAQTLTDLVRDDPDPDVRRAALAALIGRGRPTRAHLAWSGAIRDVDAATRRAAVERAPALAARSGPEYVRALRGGVVEEITALLDDRAPLVVEAVAFVLGELVGEGVDSLNTRNALAGLMRHGAGHSDPLVRESCVAALGALGAAGAPDAVDALPVLLAAARDKPAIRRRAVIALAAFEGPEVDRALNEALTDRDWQVRQLAEDLSAHD